MYHHTATPAHTIRSHINSPELLTHKKINNTLLLLRKHLEYSTSLPLRSRPKFTTRSNTGSNCTGLYNNVTRVATSRRLASPHRLYTMHSDELIRRRVCNIDVSEYAVGNRIWIKFLLPFGFFFSCSKPGWFCPTMFDIVLTIYFTTITELSSYWKKKNINFKDSQILIVWWYKSFKLKNSF